MINWCAYLRCKRSKFRNQIVYEKGINAVQKDIDFLKLIKTVKKLKVMFKIMLKDYQRPLLKFASMNIISSQSLNVKPMLKHAKVQKSLEKSIRRLMRSEKETSLKLLQMLENKRKVVSYDNE